MQDFRTIEYRFLQTFLMYAHIEELYKNTLLKS